MPPRNDDTAIEDSTIEYAASGGCPGIRVRLRCDGLTDVGRVRPNNEDNFLVARLNKTMHVCRSSLETAPGDAISEEVGHLLAVADGLGGAVAGERASAEAIRTVEDFVLNCFKWFLHNDPDERDELHSEFEEALKRADREVYRRARVDRSLRGMGTTLTMAYTVRGELFVAHAGDSRAYLLRDGRLDPLTRDHTYAQMLVDAGELAPDDAEARRYRHVVTNVVGGPSEGVTVEVHKLDLRDGDALLLCTDGLSTPVEDKQIAATLAAHDDPAAACRALRDLALDAGGPDNLAIVVARFEIERR